MLMQLLLIAFAVFLVIRAFKQYKAKKVAWTWFLLWLLFGALVVVVTIEPEVTNAVAHLVGIGRGADLVVYTSLAVLFYSLFRLTVRVDQQQRDITELVRKIAIDRAEKPEDKV